MKSRGQIEVAAQINSWRARCHIVLSLLTLIQSLKLVRNQLSSPAFLAYKNKLPTHGITNGLTGGPSYEDARTQLKR